MTWTTAQQIRLETERTVLARYFPRLFWYHPTDPRRTYVEGELTTNSRRQYALRVLIPATYPATCPTMLIRRPAPLTDHRGRPLTDADADMHTHAAVDGATCVCHFHPDRWVPGNTLYPVVLKGRIWLEAYETHLRTGLPIDRYLARTTDETASPRFTE